MKTIKNLLKIGLVFGAIITLVPQSAFAQQALSVYCQANPTTGNSNTQITYTAYATGGNASYSYIWSGSDNLSGINQTISHVYPYVSGQQNAMVLVFSGTQQASATCSSNITNTGYNNNYNNNYNNLTAYCYSRPSNVNVGELVTWVGSATGGNGGYTYSWSGDESLYGTNDIIARSYSFSGTKNATFTVYSNGQSVSTTCSANVGNNGNPIYTTQYPTYYTGNPSSGVFLSQVPYTGGGMSFSVMLFCLALFLWSCLGAYLIVSKQNRSEKVI